MPSGPDIRPAGSAGNERRRSSQSGPRARVAIRWTHNPRTTVAGAALAPFAAIKADRDAAQSMCGVAGSSLWETDLA